jgi:hypothetical protein
VKYLKGIFLLSIIILFSCEKEKQALPWKIHYSSPGNTLSAIMPTSLGEVLAVGGDSWYRGVTVESSGDQETWIEDSVCNKQLFGLARQNDKTWMVGIDGYYFEKWLSSNWRFYRLGHWDIIRDVVPVNENKIIAVGGVAFENGVIFHIEYGGIRQVYRFEHELRWIKRIEEDHYLAGGFGLVLASTDGGYTWEEVDIKGDFFTDAHFISPSQGYIVGYAGTIWKTTDGGRSWEKLKGQNVFSSLAGFQAIHFLDDETGLIAGENGNVLLTTDGGEEWKEVTGLPGNIDWYDLVLIDRSAWLCGSKGHILEISLP